MQGDAAEFSTLMTALLSTDNDVRSNAETAFEAIPSATRLSLLLQLTQEQTGEPANRSLAAVLCRKMIMTDFGTLWPTPEQPDEGLKQLKEGLLTMASQEPSVAMKKKMGDIIAELSRRLRDEDETVLWPEVLRFLFEAANAEAVDMRWLALYIIYMSPSIFGNQRQHYGGVLSELLNKSLADPSPAVHNEAAKAMTSLLTNHAEDEVFTGQFKALMPGLLQVVAASTSSGEDESVMKCLVDVAESAPKLLRTQLQNVVVFCLSVCSSADVEDNWRHLALEVILSLCESAPAMFRKLAGDSLATIVPFCLRLMSDLEDDDEEEWTNRDSAEEPDMDPDSNPYFGETALDRLCIALGGKCVLPRIVETITPLMASQQWNERHGALMAISASGEGCREQMKASLEQMVVAVSGFIGDQHPRVRYAALNCLGQMCTDFEPLIQKKLHQPIMTAILKGMSDTNPRVQAHACAALVNFTEDCPKNIVGQYLDTCLQRLEEILGLKFQELLAKRTKLVLEQTVTTLAAVASSANDRFTKYYDRFMPNLKYIMRNATDSSLQLLRGKTIECISLIGLAVGKEKFFADCQEVMNLLLESQQLLTEDDPQLYYMISSWARMCKILGSDFCPYLPLVMPAVLKTASMKPDVTILNDEEARQLGDEEEWTYICLGDQQNVGIRTAGLEDKLTACQMLVCYATELKGGFLDYVEKTTRIMVQHLKFYFHEGIRIASAESLPPLLECAKEKDVQYQKRMWEFMVNPLLSAIDAESDRAVLSQMLASLGACIQTIDSPCLTEEQLDQTVQLLDKLLSEQAERQVEREKARQDEDYDDQVEETLMEENEEDIEVLSKLTEVLHACFAVWRSDFLVYFNKLSGTMSNFLALSQPWTNRQWAVCVWDDVIEYASPASFNMAPLFLERLVQCCVDPQPEVRQAAAYGVGVMARCGGAVYTQVVTNAIPLLVQAIQQPNSRSEEDNCATENCVSALLKAAQYTLAEPERGQLLSAITDWLPIWEDGDEAEECYDFLLGLLAANDVSVLGPDQANLPKFFSAFATVLERETLANDSTTRSKILDFFRAVRGDDATFGRLVNALNAEQQVALRDALGG